MLLGGEWLLRLLFDGVEPDVTAACVTYLRISAYSYPALAVYNSGAAIYRSLGKTDVTDPHYASAVIRMESIWLVLIHNVFNAAVFPFFGALSNGLRTAGDVKYAMVISVVSTLVVRLFLSWLLGTVFDMGVIGIAAAMACDWVFRAVVFFLRLKSGQWKNFQVIKA